MLDFGSKENQFLYEYTTQFEKLQLALVTQIKEADKIKSDLNVASNKIETIKTYDKNWILKVENVKLTFLKM